MAKRSIGCGGTILVLIVVGIVISQIAKWKSDVEETKIQQREAKEKQQLQVKLRDQFSHDRDKILQNIEKLIEEKQYVKAENASQPYLFLKDSDLLALHNKAKEEILYAEVRNISAKEWEKNRDGYAELMKLNPDKELYKTKFQYYDYKIKKREEAHKRRVARFGEVPTKDVLFGGYYEVEKYLKSVAHDPDSIKFGRCTEVYHTENGWLVGCEFRGKNAFGAYVRNFNWFTIRHGQVIGVDEANAYSVR